VVLTRYPINFMKRCPTCDKTFDDAMRFCQTDGTPLVDAPEPVDPYKTMVARPEDIAAAIPPSQRTPKAEEEVLEIPPEAPSDPKKTMYASESEIREAMAEVDEQVIDVPPMAEPEPPQFIEPNLGATPAGGPPPSPFGGGAEPTSRTTPPIPSPFDQAPPSFEPAEERFEAPEPERPSFAEPERPAAEEPFGSPFDAREPSSPIVASAESMPRPAAQDTNWQDNKMQNPQFQGAAGAAQNKTLAIVSLVLGILGMTICCGSLLPSLGALITGFMARGKANTDPGNYGGAGLALGGIITGVIGLLLSIGYLVFVFFMGGLQIMMQGMQ
jgi:hypothetical protein